MRQLSRRHLVVCLMSFLIAGSGCAKTNGNRNQIATETPTEQQYTHSLQDPEVKTIRQIGRTPPIQSSLITPTRNWITEEWVVTSENEREALQFTQSATNTAELVEFVNSTDLSAHSLLIHQYPVRKCVTKQIEQIKWKKEENNKTTIFKLIYSAVESDVNCQENTESDVEAKVVRIPNHVEEIGEFGSETSY